MCVRACVQSFLFVCFMPKKKKKESCTWDTNIMWITRVGNIPYVLYDLEDNIDDAWILSRYEGKLLYETIVFSWRISSNYKTNCVLGSFMLDKQVGWILCTEYCFSLSERNYICSTKSEKSSERNTTTINSKTLIYSYHFLVLCQYRVLYLPSDSHKLDFKVCPFF